MSVTTESPEQTIEPRHTAADAQRMFRWSEFLDLGPDAEACEHSRDGTCENPDHFHTWVRIPNPIQHRDIREKAMAAQARKQRALRDPESDAYVILEAGLDTLRHGGTLEPVIAELTANDYASDLLEAQREVMEEEAFEHIIADQERRRAIEAMPEDEQPADERDELERHLNSWAERIEAVTEEKQEHRAEAMRAMSPEQLIDTLRRQKVEQEGTEEYMHVYGLWEMVACAYTTEVHATLRRPTKHHFASPIELREVAPEIIDAVREKLDELRVAQQRAASGNS